MLNMEQVMDVSWMTHDKGIYTLFCDPTQRANSMRHNYYLLSRSFTVVFISDLNHQS